MANFLDKAIAAISPEKGYRRAMARTALSIINNGTGYGNYGASHTSRSMRSWHVGGGSAKEDINIGISMKKGNTALKDAINEVLATMTTDDYNTMMTKPSAYSP